MIVNYTILKTGLQKNRRCVFFSHKGVAMRVFFLEKYKLLFFAFFTLGINICMGDPIEKGWNEDKFLADRLLFIQAHPEMTATSIDTAITLINNAILIHKRTKNKNAITAMEVLIKNATDKNGKINPNAIATNIINPFTTCEEKIKAEEENNKTPLLSPSPLLLKDVIEAYIDFGEKLATALNILLKNKKFTEQNLETLKKAFSDKTEHFLEMMVAATPDKNKEGIKDKFQEQNEIYENFFVIAKTFLKAKAPKSDQDKEEMATVIKVAKAKKLKLPFTIENILKVATGLHEDQSDSPEKVTLDDLAKAPARMMFIAQLWDEIEKTSKELSDDQKKIANEINPDQEPINYPKLVQLVARPISEYVQRLIDEGTNSTLSAETLEKAFRETGKNIIIAAKLNYEVVTKKPPLLIHRSQNFERAFNTEFVKWRDTIAIKLDFLNKHPQSNEKEKLKECLSVLKDKAQTFKVFFAMAKLFFKNIETHLKNELLKERNKKTTNEAILAAIKEATDKDIEEKQKESLLKKARKALKKSKGITEPSLIAQAAETAAKSSGFRIIKGTVKVAFHLSAYVGLNMLSTYLGTNPKHWWSGLASWATSCAAESMGRKLIADLTPESLMTFLAKHNMRYIPLVIQFAIFPVLEQIFFSSSNEAQLTKWAGTLSTLSEKITKDDPMIKKMFKGCINILGHKLTESSKKEIGWGKIASQAAWVGIGEVSKMISIPQTIE